MLRYEDLTIAQKKELLRMLNAQELTHTLRIRNNDIEQYRIKKFKKRNAIYNKIAEGYFDEVLKKCNN